MKKKLIIGFGIILIAIALFIGVDYLTFVIAKKISNDPVNYTLMKTNFSYETFVDSVKFPEPIGANYKKKGILLLGEGLTQGACLEEHQTLGAKLSAKTRRPVYNRASSGKFIQHALLQIENYAIDNYIKNSEFAIIIVPSYQDTYRLKTYPGPVFTAYDLAYPCAYPVYQGNSPENLHLRHQICPVFSSSCIYRLLEKIIVQVEENKSDKNMNNLMNHLKRLRDDLTEINPDIKLIVMTFYENIDMLEDLQNERNILIYSIADNVPNLREDKKYYAEDNIPSELLWTKVANQLAAKFKM